MNNKQTVTASRNAARVLECDAYWSGALRGLLADLYETSIELRRAWIAPHRFNVREAEMKLAEISDKIQQQIGVEH